MNKLKALSVSVNNMSDEHRQYKVLAWAFSFLKEYDREERVAELLLQHHLKVDRATFFTRMQEPVSPEVLSAFKADIKAHIRTGIPIQHLTGYEYFYGRKFYVNEHVLIPRMETEELVYHVVEKVKDSYKTDPVTIVDVGTGSGVIATTLALEIPNANVVAIDISEEALNVAKENAAQLKANITFYQGNFLQPMIEKGLKPEIIVSNPPYISWQDEPSLSDTVKNFDPALALFAKSNGLAAYQTIIKQIKSSLQQTEYIYFEIGYDQKEAITRLCHQMFPENNMECIQDINGNDRIMAISL